MPGDRHRPASDASEYSYLDHVDDAGLAWEWLRRESGYRQLVPALRTRGPHGCLDLAPASADVTSHWGCLAVASPEMRADEMPLLWSSALDRSVLRVAALPPRSSAGLVFDLSKWCDRVTVVRSPLHEHVLLDAGQGHLRIDICAGSILEGPVQMFVDVAVGVAGATSPDLLSRLHQTLLYGGGDRPVGRRDQLHRRQVAALRTFDALTNGASIRDVAICLFGAARVQAEWRGPGDVLKSTCRRLIALARQMSNGGYKILLDPTHGRPTLD